MAEKITSTGAKAERIRNTGPRAPRIAAAEVAAGLGAMVYGGAALFAGNGPCFSGRCGV